MESPLPLLPLQTHSLVSSLVSPRVHPRTSAVPDRNRTFCLLLQVNQLDKAVAAAHTFFQANPDHTEMKQNLDYYRMMAGVEDEHFRDLEAREHMVITHTPLPSSTQQQALMIRHHPIPLLPLEFIPASANAP